MLGDAQASGSDRYFRVDRDTVALDPLLDWLAD
jgi:hypothetical protein